MKCHANTVLTNSFPKFWFLKKISPIHLPFFAFGHLQLPQQSFRNKNLKQAVLPFCQKVDSSQIVAGKHFENQSFVTARKILKKIDVHNPIVFILIDLFKKISFLAFIIGISSILVKGYIEIAVSNHLILSTQEEKAVICDLLQ